MRSKHAAKLSNLEFSSESVGVSTAKSEPLLNRTGALYSIILGTEKSGLESRLQIQRVWRVLDEHNSGWVENVYN